MQKRNGHMLTITTDIIIRESVYTYNYIPIRAWFGLGLGLS